MTAKVNKLQGFDTWLGMTTDSRCYTEIFDKGRTQEHMRVDYDR